MKRALLIAIWAALVLARPASAVVETPGGSFIEGKVLPPGIGAQVIAHPKSVLRRQVTVAVGDDGSYRLEVQPGAYRIVASAPGYAYAGEESLGVRKVALKLGETVSEINFDLVPGATISGRITRAGPGAVALAMQRSPLPRSQRFTQWTHIQPETGAYTIDELRPGVYDLLIVAPERGLIDGRGWLLGRPDTLSPADRKALLEMQTRYAEVRRRSDYRAMLRLFSKEFSDTANNTYASMAQQAADSEDAEPGEVTLAKYSWRLLLLQGDARTAAAVATQVSAIRHRRFATTLGGERTDFLVQYRKESGRWLFYRMEPIRAYRGLVRRIINLTGHPCTLPRDYVATYSDDPRIGCIKLEAGQISRRHNYIVGGKR